MQAISWPANVSVMQSVVADSPVDKARELICEQALIVGAPYVWFVDDDTVPPTAALRMLLHALEQHPEAGAIGGIYCIKEEPTYPLVFNEFGNGPFWDWRAGEVFPIWAVGTGCMLIRTEALKNLPKPWFKFIDMASNEGVFSEGLKVNNIYVGEDVYFCDKLKQAGYKVLAHGGVLCDHWDMQTGKCYSLPKDSRPYKDSDATES